MIASRMKFAAAGALAVGFFVMGLRFLEREGLSAPLTLAKAERAANVDAGTLDPELVHQPAQAGRPVRADIQPNYFDFGSVRVGATVEGSVRIFRETEKSSGTAIKVEPPAFLRIDDLKVDVPKIGGNPRPFCDLSFSVDTERAGSYSGEIRVEIGRQLVAIPVSVTVRPQMPNLTRLLVVSSPFDRFSTSDATIFAPWLELINQGHFDVHYVEARAGMPVLASVDLEKIDVVLVGMDGMVSLQEPDTKLLKQFMEKGGRAIVTANAFFRGTVGKANELLIPYGLRLWDIETHRQPEYHVGAAEIAGDPLTHGVKSLYFHRPSPVIVTDKTKGKILVATPGDGSEGFVAIARAGQGEVIAIGESLWWNWIAQGKGNGSDNGALMANLLQKFARRR